MTARDLILPALAGALLLLYVYVFWLVQKLAKTPGSGVPSETHKWVFATVGTLVSTAAAVELGLNKVNGLGFTIAGGAAPIPDLHKWTSGCMLVVWLATGAWAAFIAFAQSPNGNGDARVLIENHAKAWIGFAIAAVSMYLGLPKTA